MIKNPKILAVKPGWKPGIDVLPLPASNTASRQGSGCKCATPSSREHYGGVNRSLWGAWQASKQHRGWELRTRADKSIACSHKQPSNCLRCDSQGWTGSPLYNAPADHNTIVPRDDLTDDNRPLLCFGRIFCTHWHAPSTPRLWPLLLPHKS